MADEKVQTPDPADPATKPTVDWAALRAQAEKLGISLSELQQREREKQLRLARKGQGRPPVAVNDDAPKP